MRVPAGTRRNGGHNIEITDVTGCLPMTCIIDFISPTSWWRSTVADSTLSLVDFYNEMALQARSVVMFAGRHPRATINFPLFHDLAKGRRLMSTYTIFALVNRTIRLAYEAYPLRSLQLKWNLSRRVQD